MNLSSSWGDVGVGGRCRSEFLRRSVMDSSGVGSGLSPPALYRLGSTVTMVLWSLPV